MMEDQKTPPKFAASAATSLAIGGVKVNFPVKPYPSQLSMMSMIIKGLERKQHCLLESPTGSGKSLALLCSALAWQQARYEKAEEEMVKAMTEEMEKDCCTCTCARKENGDSAPSTSKYFQQTDEHKNDSVIDLCSDDDEDFKKPVKHEKDKPKEKEIEPLCNYCTNKTKPDPDKEKQLEDKPPKKIKVPKIWFGTRTHKQIAQITSEFGRTGYSNAKMTILSSRQHSCIHPYVMTSSNKNEDCRELRKGTHRDMLGDKCMYYQNVHRTKNHYQLMCAGMNYAWDLEELIGLGKTVKSCPYYSAKELVSTANIVFCPYNYLIDPMIRDQMQINLNNQIIILDEAHNIEDCARDAGSFTLTEDALANTTSDLEYLITDGIRPDDHKPLHLLCSRLGQWVSEHTRNLTVTDYEKASQVWFGRDINTHLNQWGITPDTLPLIQRNFANATDSGEEATEEPRLMHSSSQATLGGLFNVLRYMMMNDYKYCDDYRVTIIKETSFGSVPPKRTRDGWVTIHKKPKKHFVTSVHFWCLNPAVAFNDLSTAHTIILTSGTLSPMSSFSSELGLAFPIQLEANHVIKDSQVWVGSIGRGPNGVQLQATYQNTDKFSFQDELGALVREVCRTVPHGVLCFFSSYNMIKKLKERWQATGLWGSIEETKTIICEPRSGGKDEFDSVLKTFYDTVKESENMENSRYSSCTGALLLAVCRGKVSEGLDFADNNARAVITVGIPFPSIKDKQVELKRKYNDMHKAQRGLLSGSQWYEIQAYRAMNQALGRCIRHKNDWGALIIVDDRFCKNPKKYCQGLSKWVRQKVQSHFSYKSALESITAFVQAQSAQNGSASVVEKMLSARVEPVTVVHAIEKNPVVEDIDLTLKEEPETRPSQNQTLQLLKNLESEEDASSSRQRRSSILSFFNKATPVQKEKSENKTKSQKHASFDDEHSKTEMPLSPDDDFQDFGKQTKKLQTPKNSVKKTGNCGIKHVESAEYNETLVNDLTNMEGDTDDLLDLTIPATPEKMNDVTIIPESPCSVQGEVWGAGNIENQQVQRILDFKPENTQSSSRKRKPTQSHSDTLTPSSKRVDNDLDIDQLVTEDSGEFLPRRGRRRLSNMQQKDISTKDKTIKSGLCCKSCDMPFYEQQQKIEKQSFWSAYLSKNFCGNMNRKMTQNSMRDVYMADCEKIIPESMKQMTSSGTLSVLLDSAWCSTDQRCYQLYKCSMCETLVAARIVSDTKLQSSYIFLADRVT